MADKLDLENMKDHLDLERKKPEKSNEVTRTVELLLESLKSLKMEHRKKLDELWKNVESQMASRVMSFLNSDKRSQDLLKELLLESLKSIKIAYMETLDELWKNMESQMASHVMSFLNSDKGSQDLPKDGNQEERSSSDTMAEDLQAGVERIMVNARENLPLNLLGLTDGDHVEKSTAGEHMESTAEEQEDEEEDEEEDDEEDLFPRTIEEIRAFKELDGGLTHPTEEWFRCFLLQPEDDAEKEGKSHPEKIGLKEMKAMESIDMEEFPMFGIPEGAVAVRFPIAKVLVEENLIKIKGSDGSLNIIGTIHIDVIEVLTHATIRRYMREGESLPELPYDPAKPMWWN